jgi:hypothetical protein
MTRTSPRGLCRAAAAKTWRNYLAQRRAVLRTICHCAPLTIFVARSRDTGNRRGRAVKKRRRESIVQGYQKGTDRRPPVPCSCPRSRGEYVPYFGADHSFMPGNHIISGIFAGNAVVAAGTGTYVVVTGVL